MQKRPTPIEEPGARAYEISIMEWDESLPTYF